MKNHLPSAIILFVLLLAFCFHAIAADNKSYSGTSTLASTQSGYLFTSTLETSSVDYLDVIDPVATDTVATLLRTTPDITVNGTWIAGQTATITADGTTYLSITPVLQALSPNVSVTLKMDGSLHQATASLWKPSQKKPILWSMTGIFMYHPWLWPKRMICCSPQNHWPTPWAVPW
ncbi:MAG: hypothetical protein ACLR1T_04480 [Evtepia gabavorous]